MKAKLTKDQVKQAFQETHDKLSTADDNLRRAKLIRKHAYNAYCRAWVAYDLSRNTSATNFEL